MDSCACVVSPSCNTSCSRDGFILDQDEIEAIRAEVSSKCIAEGRAKGLAEGRAKGRAEGKKQGFAEGLAEGLAEGEAKGLAKGLARGRAEGYEIGCAKAEAEVIEGLRKRFKDKLSKEELDELINSFHALCAKKKKRCEEDDK